MNALLRTSFIVLHEKQQPESDERKAGWASVQIWTFRNRDWVLVHLRIEPRFLAYQACSIIFMPVPVAARSRAWVCGHSTAEIMGSNPHRGHGCLSVVSVVCCQVEVSATG